MLLLILTNPYRHSLFHPAQRVPGLSLSLSLFFRFIFFSFHFSRFISLSPYPLEATCARRMTLRWQCDAQSAPYKVKKANRVVIPASEGHIKTKQDSSFVKGARRGNTAQKSQIFRQGEGLDGDCIPCPAGTNSNRTGLTSSADCKPCKSGDYRSATMSDCQPCPPKTYAKAHGSPVCLDCPYNTFSMGGSVQCEVRRIFILSQISQLPNHTLIYFIFSQISQIFQLSKKTPICVPYYIIISYSIGLSQQRHLLQSRWY